MFDAPDPDRHGCPICRTHYVLHATGWRPACTCEHDAAVAAEQAALIGTVRGPLDDCQRAVAQMLRAGTGTS